MAMEEHALAKQTVAKIKAIKLTKAERAALQSELEALAEIEQDVTPPDNRQCD